jgi:hypothetical protein
MQSSLLSEFLARCATREFRRGRACVGGECVDALYDTLRTVDATARSRRGS